MLLDFIEASKTRLLPKRQQTNASRRLPAGRATRPNVEVDPESSYPLPAMSSASGAWCGARLRASQHSVSQVSFILRVVLWENAFYSNAHADFMEQIPGSQRLLDIVIGGDIRRRGWGLPPLPASFPVMTSGTPYPSGTAYEVLSAIDQSASSGRPEVFLFRKTARVTVPLDDMTQAAAEFARLGDFFRRYIDGRFAYSTFDTSDRFEALLESTLRRWMEKHIEDVKPTWRTETQGSPFPGACSLSMRRMRMSSSAVTAASRAESIFF